MFRSKKKLVTLSILCVLIFGVITYLVVSHLLMKQKPLLDQLQEQVIDFVKKRAEKGHLKLHDLKVELVWQQMIDDETAVGIFDVDQITTVDVERAEDHPRVKGMINYKTENLEKLSNEDLGLVDSQIQQWTDIIDRYRTEPDHSGMRLKISEKIIKGKLDPATAVIYGEGVMGNDYHPISLKDVPSDEEVEQDAYKSLENMLKQSK